MNDEQLSALLDDELTREATAEAVTELLATPQAHATWGRYQMIGDALRAGASEQASPANVARPSTDNVVPFARPERKPVTRTGLGLAAAAALAAVALIIAKPGPHGSAVTNSIAQNTTVAPTVGPAQQRVVADDTLAGNDNGASFGPTNISQIETVREDEAQKRLNTYLINFNEQRARQRTPGVHPYVRIVGYDTP